MARKAHNGFMLLWVITASNKMVIFEIAIPYLIMVIITIIVGRKISACIMLMLFITQRLANGKYHHGGCMTCDRITSCFGASGNHSIHKVFR